MVCNYLRGKAPSYEIDCYTYLRRVRLSFCRWQIHNLCRFTPAATINFQWWRLSENLAAVPLVWRKALLSYRLFVTCVLCRRYILTPPRPTHLCKVGDIDSFRSYGGAAHVRGQLTAATVENVSNSYINFQVCRPIRMRNLNDFRYSWRRRHVHSLGQKDVWRQRDTCLRRLACMLCVI